LSQTSISDTDPALTFETLTVPLHIGEAQFVPNEPAVKKFAYAVDDETGWIITDEGDRRAHPSLMANYLWWPQGFYVQEPTGAGHFVEILRRFPRLIAFPWLHTRTAASFHRAPILGETIYASADITDKYVRRDKEHIVIKATYTDPRGHLLAEYEHTCMIRSRVKIEARPQPAQTTTTSTPDTPVSPATRFPARGEERARGDWEIIEPIHVTLTLANARLFSLPLESFHTHDSLAKDAGFPKAVPQGLMSFGYLSRLCTDYFGEQWCVSGTLEVKFINMLYRDDRLTIGGRVADVDPLSDATARVHLDLFVDDDTGRRVAAGTATGLLNRSADRCP
jgi:acyl dehydratase